MQTTAMPIVSATAKPVVFGPAKDSRWLTLEVCREFARNKCTRLDDECRFAHPPSNIEIQNGRVMCCFDSIKGRCQRSDPPCKYLHPPQHLKEQLLQNGRNNLIWRNFQMQQLSSSIQQFVPAMFPVLQQGPSGPPPPPAAAVPPASYLISANAPAATYYHSPLPSTATTNESPVVSMATMAVMTGMVQPTTCNTDQSEVAESPTETVTLSSAPCLANGGGSQNQYWLNPAFLDSSLSTANYYSPVFYQGLNQIVPVAKTHLIPADLRNGNVAMFSCGGSPSYQQVTLPSAVTGCQQQPCYRLTVPGALPVMQRY